MEKVAFEHDFDSGRDADLTPGELLAVLANLGVISAENLYLITATRIDGKALKAIARELNQNYETVRKRHHRTTRAILKF